MCFSIHQNYSKTTATNKQTNKQTNNQASKQASKQANKQASKQANKQASKQANKQASKQTNKQASKQTNKQTTNQQPLKRLQGQHIKICDAAQKPERVWEPLEVFFAGSAFEGITIHQPQARNGLGFKNICTRKAISIFCPADKRSIA